MKAALLQTDIVWGDPQANLERAQRAIEETPGADIYILPEMFTTGFATQEEARIDETPEVSVAWMKEIAARYNCAVAGSIAMRSCTTEASNCETATSNTTNAATNEPAAHTATQTGQANTTKLVNRFHFVTPDGRVTIYDKRHLFTYGGEPDRFTAGENRVIAEFRGMRFLLLVCYDLRFPVWIRNRNDYDAIICVANWPEVRQMAWETLLRARAIENQCFVAGVNRVGTDPVCVYRGGTTLYNPYGNEIARCADGEACAAIGEMDMSLLEEFRGKFPVLEDADNFEMSL